MCGPRSTYTVPNIRIPEEGEKAEGVRKLRHQQVGGEAARRRSTPISALYFGLNLLAINTNYVGLILDLNIDFYTLENVF